MSSRRRGFLQGLLAAGAGAAAIAFDQDAFDRAGMRAPLATPKTLLVWPKELPPITRDPEETDSEQNLRLIKQLLDAPRVRSSVASTQEIGWNGFFFLVKPLDLVPQPIEDVYRQSVDARLSALDDAFVSLRGKYGTFQGF